MNTGLANETHFLSYIGMWFDPKANYTQQTENLINDLIHYRGKEGATKATNTVIKLVRNRLANPKPPKGLDLEQQRAFLRWLLKIQKTLNPSQSSNTKRRSRKAEKQAMSYRQRDKQRHRNKIGLLKRECQIYKIKEGLAKTKTK